MASIRPNLVRLYVIGGPTNAAEVLVNPAWGSVVLGPELAITDGNDSQPFRFPTGEICVPRSGGSKWSDDAGESWTDSLVGFTNPGPRNSSEKTAIALGGNEILSIRRDPISAVSNSTVEHCRRSTDYWASVTDATVGIDGSGFIAVISDAGIEIASPLIHHDIRHLKNGRMMLVGYGRKVGDEELMTGYPKEWEMMKWRTQAWFSEIGNKGANWASPVDIFSKEAGIYGRGTNASASVFEPGVNEWQVQEGAAEATFTERANGDLWVFCRTGGRQSGSVHLPELSIYPSPPMMRVLNANGTPKTSGNYQYPIQLPVVPVYDIIHGNNPEAITLGNDVTILTCGGPGGGYFTLHQPGNVAPVPPISGYVAGDPVAFESTYKFSTSDSYTSIVKIAYNRSLLFYGGGNLKCRTLQVDLTDQADSTLHQFDMMGPYCIPAGQQSRLTWFSQNSQAPRLYGGAFQAGGAGTAISPNSSVATGILTTTTTYWIDDTGMDPVSVTITVV